MWSMPEAKILDHSRSWASIVLGSGLELANQDRRSKFYDHRFLDAVCRTQSLPHRLEGGQGGAGSALPAFEPEPRTCSVDEATRQQGESLKATGLWAQDQEILLPRLPKWRHELYSSTMDKVTISHLIANGLGGCEAIEGEEWPSNL